MVDPSACLVETPSHAAHAAWAQFSAAFCDSADSPPCQPRVREWSERTIDANV